jgi:phosphatidylglycerophosphatase A
MINNQGNICQPPPVRRTLWAWTIATFFGAGCGKPGPGTWGSVAAVLIWAACAKLLHPAPQTLLIALVAAIVLTLLTALKPRRCD